MKIKLILPLLGLLFFQCKDADQATSSKIENYNTAKEKENVTTKANQVLGGFSATEVTPFIKELAYYVLDENNITSPLKDVTNAASQVVSGTNYKFNMLLEDGKKYMTKVYVNLKGQKEITEFKLVP